MAGLSKVIVESGEIKPQSETQPDEKDVEVPFQVSSISKSPFPLKSAMTIPEAPKPEVKDRSSEPTNTVIMEIDSEEIDPQSTDQSRNAPSRIDSTLAESLVEAMKTSAIDDDVTTQANVKSIMYAVPKLHPERIPSVARIVGIADGQTAQSSRRPYSLTVVAPLKDNSAQPIAPVLDGLRTGRRIEAPGTSVRR